jgi:hypothetical protein
MGTTVSLVGQARPIGVTTAAVLQLLLAVTFLIMPIVVIRHGAKAQAAAEADVVRQGFPADLLVRNHVQFGEQAVGLLVPVAIALCLVILAVLNLRGNEIGRIGSWILQPILLVAGGLVTYRQAYATRFLESAFKKTGDPTLARIDVKAFVDAAFARLSHLVPSGRQGSLRSGDHRVRGDPHPAHRTGGECLLRLSAPIRTRIVRDPPS